MRLQACYAMGYNLAIEYLADYEKTWMLDSFRALDARVLAPQGRPLTEWVFLEVSPEGQGGQQEQQTAGWTVQGAPQCRRRHWRLSLPAGPLPHPTTHPPFPPLQVHAEGEAEHAAIGHDAVMSFVPAAEEAVLRRAMLDHDRDMAAFYNHLADLLEA